MPSGLEGFFNSSGGQGLLAGLGGLAGFFPSKTSLTGSGSATTNTQGETNTSQSSNASSQLQNLLQLISSLSTQGSQTQTTTPNLTPQTQQLIDKLTSSYSQLAKPVDLSGYQATQAQNINANSDLARQAAANIMASRGLATSPVSGTTEANIEANRIAQQTQLNQSLPLLQNQLTLNNLGAASGFMNLIPHGSTTTGTTTQEQQQQQQQQQNQNTQNWANQFGYQSINQSQNTNQVSNQTQSKGGGIGSAIGGIASVLASLFSDKRLKEDIKKLPREEMLDKILQLQPKSWKWKGTEYEDSGVVAQELEKLFPDLVHKDAETNFEKVNYAGLTGALISAMQGLNDKIESRV